MTKSMKVSLKKSPKRAAVSKIPEPIKKAYLTTTLGMPASTLRSATFTIVKYVAVMGLFASAAATATTLIPLAIRRRALDEIKQIAMLAATEVS